MVPAVMTETAKNNNNHAPKARPGRPTKLNPEVQAKICAIIADGNYDATAAQCCGIDPKTFLKWLARGKDPNHPNYPLYSEFREAVKKARAERERKLVGYIATAALEKKHWTAAAWMLERLYRDHWGKPEYRGDGNEARTIAEEVQEAIKQIRGMRPKPPEKEAKEEES